LKLSRNPSIQTKLLPDGHVVLFSAEYDWAHTLSPLAGIAWEYCDGTASFDEIVKLVSETAGITDAAEIEKELKQLFDELTGVGLLQQTSAVDSPKVTA
jgi:hypothetical protein